MDTPDRAEIAHFSQPIRQIISMLVVLGLVAFGVRLVAPQVAPVFLANPYLNGFIAFVFVVGVLTCFWQTYQVVGSVRWLRGFVAGDSERVTGHAPLLLAPLATLLRSRPGMMRISPASSRSILDSVATRIDEARDITRYIVNLLIFLGLLGTFYGLATTVPALVETIRALAPQGSETGIDVFNRLMSGLEGQLDGMGIAFASSLIGLAGSLVVGLLELFAGHGQNRFYRELEEWLSSITRVGFSSAEGEGASASPALDGLFGQLDELQSRYGALVGERAATDTRLERLTDALEALALRMDISQGADPSLSRIAEGQERVAALLEQQSPPADLAPLIEGQARMVRLMEEAGAGTLDAESRLHLRSIDAHLLRILEEMAAGRQEAVDDLRGELAQLSRVIRQLSAGRRHEPPTPIVGRRV
jgi:hypothetical protein